MDLSYVLEVAANKHGPRTALVYRGERTSYAALDETVNRLAERFRTLGYAAAPVAWVALNEPLTVALYLAIARAGGTSVPVNPRLLVGEKEYIVRDAGAATLVVDRSFADEGATLLDRIDGLGRVLVVDELAALAGEGSPDEVDPGLADDALATIMYTSGTTGHPKGVLRTQGAYLWNVMNSALGMARTPEDVELFNLPIFGIGFPQHVLPLFLAGGTVVMDRIFDPARAWELLQEHRVTRTFLAPTMIDSMLAIDGHETYDVSSLHTIGVAYEFSDRLRARALERFGDVFINMYGLTEAQLFCTRLGEFAGDPTSTGTPMGLMRVRIVGEDGREVPRGDVGEITLEGPTVMSGYHGLPEETEGALRGGWLHTGDLGRLDASGNLHFAGRSKEIVKTGGFNVDPVEVENVLLEREDVREAAIVGQPDDHWGEAVVAFVALAPGAAEDVDALLAHCKERLAGFKVPKRFVVLAELPKNPTGKVERGKLRELAKGAPAG